MRNKNQVISIIYFVCIFVAAVILRFYHLSFFEFKNDQLYAILLGSQARQAHFLITHGMYSGVRIDNPPYFIYLVGILTYFTRDPYFLTAFFTFLNLLALLISFWYFCSFLPTTYAVLSSTLLAFSPAFTIYSTNIWAQCSLPIFLIFFNLCFYKFIQEEKPAYFVILNLLAGITGQIHMSGFFLFPALLILGFKYRRVIKKIHIFFISVFLFIIFLPYIYYLFGEGGTKSVFAYADRNKDIPWNIFRSHLWITSFDSLRIYSRNDFLNILKHSLGVWGFVLYPFTFIIPGLFILGFIYYIKFLKKEKSLFNKNSDSYPLPFQISGFLVSVVTLSYFVFQVRTPLHYLIVLFPCHAIITSFGAWKFWKYGIVRVATVTSIIITTVFLLVALRFLDVAGGHWCQYGPSYKMLKGLRSKIQSLTQGKLCPDLRLVLPKTGKFDEGAMRYILIGDKPCKDNLKTMPINLSIAWDDKAMRYTYLLTKGE